MRLVPALMTVALAGMLVCPFLATAEDAPPGGGGAPPGAVDEGRSADETPAAGAGGAPGQPAMSPAAGPPAQPLTREEAKRLGSLLKAADESFRRGDFEAAEANYREALYLDPVHVAAQRRLADCLLGAGQYAEAVAAYERLQQTPVRSPEERGYVVDLEEARGLARAGVEAAAAADRSMPLSDAEKRAFRDQALRVTEIHREEKDYGSALRAMGYSEWLGAEIGAPLEGAAYNELLIEAVQYHMEAPNLAALAGLFELADFLSIHSQQRADLETEFVRISRGEAEMVAVAARPYLSALDEEVQARKVEDRIRDREERRSALERIKLAFTGLIQGIFGYQRYREALAATASRVASAPESKKYVHRSSRRLDYGRIVRLSPVDAALYAAQPLLFRMTPEEWQARAVLSGYPQREPRLPATVAEGQFVVAMERDDHDMRHYYFALGDLSDPRAQVLGRYGSPGDAERALEYYAVTDFKFTEATYAHD